MWRISWLLFVVACIGQSVPVSSRTVVYEHPDLHLKFTLNTNSKEATLGTSYDNNEQNTLAYPPIGDPWWTSSDPDPYNWSNLDIPSTIICEGTAIDASSFDYVTIGRDTYTVTAVAPKAFYKSTKIRTVKLPETVCEIGQQAFYCCVSLKSILIPDNVTSVEDETFYNCRRLESIHLPSHLQRIGKGAFSDCESLMEVNIPGTCISIGRDAFTWCKSLHKLIIEDGTELLNVDCSYSIGLTYTPMDQNGLDGRPHQRGLFADCIIDTLYLGRNICYPYGYDWYSTTSSSFKKRVRPFPPFERCSEFRSYVGGYYAYRGPSLKSLQFGETVTEIADSLFCATGIDCELTLPHNLKRIGKNAFYWDAINYIIPRRIEIPASVEYIGENAFMENHIDTLVFNNGNLTLEKNSFAENKIKKLIIPEGLNLVNRGAFKNNPIFIVYCNTILPPSGGLDVSNSIPIHVPAGSGQTYREEWPGSRIVDPAEEVITINVKKAGTLLSRILAQDLTVKDFYRLKLKGILNDDDYSTLKNMSNLYDIDLTETQITNLPNGYFQGNKMLMNIKLPNTLLEIEDNAFNGCVYLSGKITIPENCSSVGERAFYGTMIESLTCEGATTIKDEAFLDLSSLKEVTFESGTNVGLNAFQATSIKTLSIPANSQISNNAFNTPTLKRVYFADGVSKIGNNVFEDNLEKITFDGLIGSIGTFVSHVDSIFVKDIETWCLLPFTNPVSNNYFYINGERVTNIVIPNNISKLRDYAFYSCHDITSVMLTNSITDIPTEAFMGCTNLKSINLPSHLKTIGKNAFAECTSLQEIDLPSELQSIGSCSFAKCESLSGIELPTSLMSIGNGAFSNCPSLKKLDLPLSLTDIGSGFYYGSTDGVVIAHWKDPITVNNISGNCYLYVPIGCSQKYINAGWNFPIRERGILSIRVSEGGSVCCDGKSISNDSYQYYFAPYKDISIVINPDENYQLIKAKLDGEDAISSIEDGEIIIEEAEEDANLYIVFGKDNYQWGDANKDNEVNENDVLAIADMIIKNHPLLFDKYAADMNDDGIINITDIILLINNVKKE